MFRVCRGRGVPPRWSPNGGPAPYHPGERTDDWIVGSSVGSDG